MKKEEWEAQKQLINKYIDAKAVNNVGELGRGIRYFNNGIDARKYNIMCALTNEYNVEHNTKISVKDHSWPIICVERKWFCPTLGMFDHPSSANYRDSSKAIKIAILTGQAAEGPEEAPYVGLHFKSASNVSVPTLKKCKVVIAKKPRTRKKMTKTQVIQALDVVATTSHPHNRDCLDCKALEALANMSKSLDTLITKGGK